jgi:DeoR family fructose operon transcriptional repressor
MLIVERQQRVLQMLRDRKAMELEELARELDVSASTIRRDLDALEREGIVERTHGGAVYIGQKQDTDESIIQGNGVGQTNGVNQPKVVLTERLQEEVDAKKAIGRYAAAQIEPHMTVILDGGSTVIYAAQQITARPLQVVTNSLAIANLFADDEQVELLVIGGSLYPRTGVMVGSFATGCLADLYADLTLFSLAGIYEDAAFNINLPMAQVEQLMTRQAARSLLLMDSSKFGRKSLVRVCGLSEVDQIVTDQGIDDTWRAQLGDRLIVADAE